VTTQEIEARLAKVDQKIITEVQLSHVRGIDYSFRGRTYRWRLNSLHRALLCMLEYNKHEHHNLKSFCRTPAKK
jgi:hypothetical protein